MDFNFFEWIREGVKRSVLMGVSDAVEQMGAPHEPEVAQDKIMSFLQSETPEAAPARRRVASTASTGGQRKLGRSISEIHPTS